MKGWKHCDCKHCGGRHVARKREGTESDPFVSSVVCLACGWADVVLRAPATFVTINVKVED